MTSPSSAAAIAPSLAGALAEVVSARLGRAVDAQPAAEPAAAAVALEYEFRWPVRGRAAIGLDAESVEALGRAFGWTAEGAGGETAGLDELGRQIADVLNAGSRRAEPAVRLAGVTPLVGEIPAASAAFVLTASADGAVCRAVCWIREMQEPARVESIATLGNNLDLILDIDLPLAVRFGETTMTVQTLSRLTLGSVIELGRSPQEPVEVLVNGRLIARGEVVIVSGNYGVRITEVMGAAERIRSLGA